MGNKNQKLNDQDVEMSFKYYGIDTILWARVLHSFNNFNF